MNIPMAQVYHYIIFRNDIGILTISGLEAPLFRKPLAEMCYLYRRTRLVCVSRLFDNRGVLQLLAGRSTKPTVIREGQLLSQPGKQARGETHKASSTAHYY